MRGHVLTWTNLSRLMADDMRIVRRGWLGGGYYLTAASGSYQTSADNGLAAGGNLDVDLGSQRRRRTCCADELHFAAIGRIVPAASHRAGIVWVLATEETLAVAIGSQGHVDLSLVDGDAARHRQIVAASRNLAARLGYGLGQKAVVENLPGTVMSKWHGTVGSAPVWV